MCKIVEKIKFNITKLMSTGFFFIVISDSFAKIVAFCGGTILVGILSKSDYGMYSYINNAYSILVAMGDMGSVTAMFEFTQGNYNDEARFRGFSSYGLRRCLLFNCIPVISILLSPYFYPYVVDGAEKMVLYLCGLPLIKNLTFFLQVNLRANLKNNKYSAVNVFSILVHYIILIPFAYKGGVFAALCAGYVYELATLALALFMNRGLLHISKKHTVCLSVSDKRKFGKFAVLSQINALGATFLTLLDVFMIGLIYSNEEIIASYKVATVIPSAVAFIPTSIMVYASPFLSRNYQKYAEASKIYRKIILCTVCVCTFIAIVGITTASWLLPLIFGKQYSDAIICYIILLIGFLFNGGLYIPSVVAINSQRKVGVTFCITVCSGAANIFLDTILIYRYGSIGAAVATAGVSIISGLAAFGYFELLVRKNSYITLRSIKGGQK